ncbi:MAG: hypothetical protein J5666_00815 [Bacilli bacterium]|nr:hypothetical protein [Bacilli bacterium]
MFKKLLKDKKGVALETAIIFMLIMFSFCTILFIVGYKEKTRDDFGNTNMNLPYRIEQIGEDFYNDCLEGNGADFAYDNDYYYGTVEVKGGTKYSLTVVEKFSYKIVLEVDVTIDTNKITKWCFYNPLNENVLIKKVDSDYFDEVN